MSGPHRSFYPTAKAGQDPREVKPVASADSTITSSGVTLSLPEHVTFTPNELKMLGRWLFALAHEAEEVGARGVIGLTSGYDVTAGKVVPSPADK